MREMTFEEWCWANHDLLDDLRAELHPSGLSFGALEAMGAEDGVEHIYGEMKLHYDAQREKDRAALRAWNAAVASVGVDNGTAEPTE